MTSAYLLAHCDDELAAWPLLRADLAEGRPVAAFFLTRPGDPRRAARRFAESRRFLTRLGVDPAWVVDLAAQTGVRDGRLLTGLDATFQAAVAHLGRLRPLTGLSCPAWEGGHLDHDLCAVLAAALAEVHPEARGVRQFGLYHGLGRPGPLFRSGPLAANGPARRVRMGARDWLAFAGAPAAFPSQFPVFLTLWPSLFASYLSGGYRVQDLEPTRVLQRPHSGRLLYERRGHGDYESVARVVRRFLQGVRGPAPDRADLTRA